MEVLKVFENEKIRVGDNYNGIDFTDSHFEALKKFNQNARMRYFHFQYPYVQFGGYVGIIQLPDLSVEILPKLDGYSSDELNWQDILPDMLLACRYSSIEWTGKALLQLKSRQLLELLLTLFLKTLKEQVFPNGLLLKSNIQISSEKAVKGKFLSHYHFKKMGLAPTEFWVQYHKFDLSHPVNLLFFNALNKVLSIRASLSIQQEAMQLLRFFPKTFSPKVLNYQQLKHLKLHPTEKYLREAIDWSLLILENNGTQLQTGQYRASGLIFSMNQLFEDFIFRQLQEAARAIEASIIRHPARPFWNHRNLYPDMVLESQGQKWVLDTKWKSLQYQQPTMDDLRQMFVYAQFFDSEKAVLIYPRVPNPAVVGTKPFHFEPANGRPVSCQILFIDIFTPQGGLRRQLGREIIEQLIPSVNYPAID